MGGSESIVMRGIEEAIARCLGVPAEQDPAELEQAVTVILTAAARMTVQGIWLRARSHALAQVADTEAQVARAQMAWQAARDRVSRTGEFAARASGNG